MRDAPMPDRRLLLTLGAATLLTACAPAAASPAPVKPTPSPSRPRRTPSAALVATCETGTAKELAGRAPLTHVPCGPAATAQVALTIDDGPDPEWTPQVLALLARYDVKATFCVVGSQAKAHPALVAAVAGAGHHVANHTYTHRFLQGAAPSRVRSEIGRATDAIVAATGGAAPTLFRAPGGAWSKEVLAQCAEQGLRPLGWSVDPRDWSRPGTAHIVSTIMRTTTPGSIILEHDGGGNRSQTVAALGVVLPRLLDAGYTFVQP